MKTQHASDASKRDGNATEQYFAAEPSSEDVRRRMKVTLRGQDAVVEVSNGVFSGSRLDLGTSVLLREVPEPPETGTLLDRGLRMGTRVACAGVRLAQGRRLGRGRERTRARPDPRQRQVQRLRAHPCRVAGAGAGRSGVRRDLVEPADPHRQGRAARPADDVAAAAQPRSAAYLVVQKNLGADSLIPWLATALGDDYEVSKYHSAKGYRVIEVLRNK